MITTQRHRRRSRASVLVACARSILMATALLTTARGEPAQLHILSEPAGASITIDGTPRGEAPITLTDLAPGKHLLVAEKSKHNSVRRTINLASAARSSQEVRLEPIRGLILIQSTPSGADIEISGAHRGNTPALISDLPMGRYRARLSKPGYIPKEIEMKIEGRSPQKFDVTLTSDSAALALDSEPAGAEVTLNGVARGKTPCTIERIPSGIATLELSLAGFEPYSESLKLSAGENQTITAKLKAIPSDLEIVTIPVGARIYVDNQFRGKSPVKLTRLAPGAYRVRAEMKAHEIMLRNVEIGRAQSIVEEFRLLRNAGGIAITTEPADVDVLLDGKSIGFTRADTNRTDRVSEPLSADLIPCGVHVLTFTKPGFYETKTEIEIIRDEIFTKHYKLARRFIPNYEVKTEKEVYRGILIEVDAQRNVKLETHPGIFKTIMNAEIKSVKPLREDKIKEDL
jgi:hypothetical protein